MAAIKGGSRDSLEINCKNQMDPPLESHNRPTEVQVEGVKYLEFSHRHQNQTKRKIDIRVIPEKLSDEDVVLHEVGPPLQVRTAGQMIANQTPTWRGANDLRWWTVNHQLRPSSRTILQNNCTLRLEQERNCNYGLVFSIGTCRSVSVVRYVAAWRALALFVICLFPNRGLINIDHSSMG